MKEKVLIIGINLSRFGSSGIIMMNALEYASINGPFDYFTFTPEGDDSDTHLNYDKMNENFFFKLKNYIIYNIFHKKPIDGEYYLENTLRIIKKIKAFKKCYKNIIVHLHTIHNAKIAIVPLYKFLSKERIKVVYTFHDSWPYTGGCYCYDYIKCEKWKSNCLDCPQKLYKTQKIFSERMKSLNLITNLNIVTVSNWEENEVQQSKIHYKSLRTIHGETNLVKPDFDVNLFKEKNNFIEKKIILSVAAYWNEWKGIKYLYSLSSLLPRNYQLLLVGGKTNLCGDFLHIRSLPSEELAKFYCIADVFVSTTQSESLGLTTCEAQICGVPIVGFGSGGSKETFTSKTGVLVKNNDVCGMADAVIKICEGQYIFEKEDIIKQGMKFSKYANSPKYLELYLEIMNKD